MGAPSGSKNCSILNDRLDFLASQFERPVYDTSQIEADTFGSEPSEREAEKKLKANEVQDFRLAASGARIEKKMGIIDKMVPKPLQAGPMPEKRKLPGFVKLKSKEASTGEGGEEIPPPKQARVADLEDSQNVSSIPAKPDEAALLAASVAPASSEEPSRGLGLAGYASDSEEDA
mmetsp:Transcript_107027/g.298064  ORF Transcript_107027/g.298064 Transcript_107027/m.298064 type:complete len:175 (-) Transcript_107027:152-676(-)